MRINTTSPTNARTIAVARDTIAMAVERVAVILSSQFSTSRRARYVPISTPAFARAPPHPIRHGRKQNLVRRGLSVSMTTSSNNRVATWCTTLRYRRHNCISLFAQLPTSARIAPAPREDGFVLRMGDGGARYLAADNVWMT